MFDFKFDLQLFGGGGGSSSSSTSTESVVKSSAPGSTAAATIDNATAGARQDINAKLANAKGRSFTNKNVSSDTSEVAGQIKKMLLGS